MATAEELTQRRKEAIKRRMERTRARLAGRLHTLGETIHGVSETVSSVKETVESTVENVQETVKSTVENVQESVKSALDFPRRHPVLWMSGSVAAGYLGGLWWHSREGAPAVPAYPAYPAGFVSPGPSPPPVAPPYAPSAEPAREEEPGFLGKLVGEWADRLKGLGIGAAVGLLRDLVASEVPPDLRDEVMETGNKLIKDLGGQVLEPMLIDPAILKGHQPEQEEEPEPPQQAPGSTRRQDQAVSAVPY